ncbi:hypothetical protein FQR65_LT03767 [Abscondita terminalis]|nr:hypothetical protein FQR65_LT03767 [Abscondita terminalis]
MLTIALVFILSPLIALVVWWYIVYLKSEKYLHKFSGPPNIPVIGSLHHFVSTKNLLGIFSNLLRQYKGPIKLMFGFYPVLIFAEPKSVEFVLSSNTILKKSFDYDFFHPWLGSGLITSLGLKWKKHRKLLTPAFHFQILERFIDVFDIQTNILIEKLEKIGNKEIDIVPLVKLHTLDIICEATMNTTVNAQMNPDSNYVNSVKEICRISTERAFSFKMWDILYFFTEDYKKEKEALGYLHGLSNSVIKNRREGLGAQPMSDITTTTNDWYMKKKVAFLDILLTSTVDGKPLTNEEIRNEVDTFLFAGHDTTAAAITFTLYALSKHPEIQVFSQIFKEITTVLGKEQLTFENLQKLKYLEQVIKEVLRMYSPVPVIARVLTEDATYEGTTIPKGTILEVLIYHLHNNPDLFPNPDVFDPERFSPENLKQISLYAFVPFSAGPRNCIAQKFAMLEVKATVCKILQKLKLLPAVGHKPILVADVVTTSENGLPLRMEKRNDTRNCTFNMLTTLFLILLSPIVVVIIWWYVIYLRSEKHLSKFPGPSNLPLIGALHHFGSSEDFISNYTSIINKYKGPVKLMLGFHPTLVLSDAKSLEFVLSSNSILQKSHEYQFFHSWLGTGLLTSFGAKWRNHRKLLTPAFHFQILEKFIEVFDNQTNILIKKLEKEISKEIDVLPLLKLHTLDVICEAAMNTSINAQMDPDSNYVKSVREISRIGLERSYSYKMFDILFRFSEDYHKEKEALKHLHGLSNSVIKNRREELQKQISNGVTITTELGTKKRIAFLDLLLTSTVDGKPLTNEDIRSEVDTFMFAGHDTTTSTIGFTLYALAKHQEIQDKVYEEVREVLGTANTELSYENLQQLKYLEQVIKEVLRFYSTVPAISRMVTEDTVYDGKTIPKGTVLQLMIYQLHHDPELFTNPEVFDPERFNAENSKQISLYSYVPFSAGPRNCIGQRFAMLEIKATVSKILQKFKLLTVIGHEPVLVVHAVTTSGNGLPVRLEKRN